MDENKCQHKIWTWSEIPYCSKCGMKETEEHEGASRLWQMPEEEDKPTCKTCRFCLVINLGEDDKAHSVLGCTHGQSIVESDEAIVLPLLEHDYLCGHYKPKVNELLRLFAQKGEE